MALIAFTQVDSGLITANARESVPPLLRVHETENINGVANAMRHVRHTQDRFSTFQSCPLHSRLS